MNVCGIIFGRKKICSDEDFTVFIRKNKGFQTNSDNERYSLLKIFQMPIFMNLTIHQ